jgi:FdhD protein
VSGNSVHDATRVLAPEALVRVRVNRAATLEWSCTPHDLPTLAVGWLACEGVVRAIDEIEDLTEDSGADSTVSVSVRLADSAFRRLTAGLSRDADLSTRPAALTPPHEVVAPDGGSASGELRSLLEDKARVAAWFSDMFDGAAIRSNTGGVHTGGLVVGGALICVAEDVSRHHVVDRLVGSALLGGNPLRNSILLVSARISGAMAAKACRAGAGALVSRSVPTELAASVAGAHGLILVGRARREKPHYYWPEGAEAE